MKQRIEWLDVMKGILILFVILSHNYPSFIYRRFFTPFFLTMFFFVSGYTFSVKSNFRDFLKNKCYRLGIPFVILGGIRVSISCIMFRQDIRESVVDFLLQKSCKGDEMWFVSCLITASILFYFIVNLFEQQDEKKILALSAGISLLGLFDICALKIKFIWELEIACMMLFYMALGFYCRKKDVLNNWIIQHQKVILCFFYGYILSIISVYNDVDIHAERMSNPVMFVLSSLIVVLPLVWISQWLSKRKVKRILIFLGQNTLFYYAFSGIGRILLYGVMQRVGIIPDLYIAPVVCTVISALLLAYPAILVKKYVPWMMGIPCN